MRAVIISHRAADPSRRSRYHALTALGCQVWLAVPHQWHPANRSEPFRTEFHEDGALQIVPIHVRGSLTGDVPARWNSRTLSRLFRDVRPDLVQIEEEPRTQAAAVATALARRLKIPTIAVTGEAGPGKLPIMQRRYEGQAIGGAAGIIATNAVAARHLAAFPGAHAIIPLAGVVPPLHPVAADEGSFVIGFTGRLVPERGLDILFEACRQVLGDWSLTVVGSGPGQEPLEALAERLGIAARVNWRGGLPAEDWARLWPTLHCLAVPSRKTNDWEDRGGPHVLEAMAHGVPVVVSDSGALPEIVGTAGVTVPADDPDAMARALRELQQSPERRESLARAVRQRALDEFTDDAIARRTLDFWHRATSRAGAATP